MSPENYLVIAFLIGLNILLVGLLIVILKSRPMIGPPGPPGAMGPIGRDVFLDLRERNLIPDDMDYETWLRYLSAVIQNQGYLERPTGLELGMGDISGPRG